MHIKNTRNLSALSMWPCLTVHTEKFKGNNIKLLWEFYTCIHHIILNRHYVPLNAFQSWRISSGTPSISQKGTNRFSRRNYWMTLASSGHLGTESVVCVGAPRMGCPKILFWSRASTAPGEWKATVSTGKWRLCSWRQCFRMADINDSPMLCTRWMFSFQKSIKTTESFQVIFFYCETRNRADDFQ